MFNVPIDNELYILLSSRVLWRKVSVILQRKACCTIRRRVSAILQRRAFDIIEEKSFCSPTEKGFCPHTEKSFCSSTENSFWSSIEKNFCFLKEKSFFLIYREELLPPTDKSFCRSYFYYSIMGEKNLYYFRRRRLCCSRRYEYLQSHIKTFALLLSYLEDTIFFNEGHFFLIYRENLLLFPVESGLLFHGEEFSMETSLRVYMKIISWYFLGKTFDSSRQNTFNSLWRRPSIHLWKRRSSRENTSWSTREKIMVFCERKLHNF